jgi:hypothetical protein
LFGRFSLGGLPAQGFHSACDGIHGCHAATSLPIASAIMILWPIQRTQGTAKLFPSALYIGPSGGVAFPRHGT